jgi:hypothetical protein
MARLLCVWELGGQLAHLANLAAVARAGREAGYEVGVALRDLDAAPLLLGELTGRWFQAPASRAPALAAPSRALCYAHLLLESGYAEPRALGVLVQAWTSVFDAFAPDVLVCDHSPTALLASRGGGMRRATVGSGFLVPPPSTPLGVFPDVEAGASNLERMRGAEERVLEHIADACAPLGLPRLEQLADLYREIDLELLLTFPELDPFPERSDAHYLGVWSATSGATGRNALPEQFVFAYLSAFPGHRALLRDLATLRLPVLVHSRDIPQRTRAEFEAPGLAFSDGLLDLQRVAGRCALFVSHGAHGSVALTLLAGVPQLVIPVFREQLFTALRVRAMGAGRVESVDRASYAQALDATLNEPRFADAATAFARRHGTPSPAARQEALRRELATVLS